VKLHVERSGCGPDLTLLHGWGMHSGVWSEVMPELESKFRVHAVDLPGHGLSAAIGATDFDSAVELVAESIPEGGAVCGWSLGGLFAQRLASRHGAKVARLGLVSATPCFVGREDWPHGMKAATLAAFAENLRTHREATLENFVRLNALHGARGRDAIRAFSRRIAERGAPSLAALENGLRWLRETDLRDAAPSLRVPTVVIHGTRDALAPIEAGRWLASRIPRCRLVEVEDAAHLPFFTHPRVFLDALDSLHG
jgi:pimeloyl-[acyl-carrier protein] methyl ester esterase